MQLQNNIVMTKNTVAEQYCYNKECSCRTILLRQRMQLQNNIVITKNAVAEQYCYDKECSRRTIPKVVLISICRYGGQKCPIKYKLKGL